MSPGVWFQLANMIALTGWPVLAPTLLVPRMLCLLGATAYRFCSRAATKRFVTLMLRWLESLVKLHQLPASCTLNRSSVNLE